MLRRQLLCSFLLASILASTSEVLADPVFDNFERTALGINWRIIFGGGSTDIVNNSDLGLKNNSTRFGLASWSASSFSPDQYSEAVISLDKNTNMLTQVFVRWRGSDSARYGFHYAGDPGQVNVFGKWEIKYDGVPTNQTRSLATANVSSPPNPGDTLRIEIRGFTIKGFHNGVEVISATDTDLSNRIPSGEPGLAYRWATSNIAGVYPAPVWESWSAGSLGVTPPPLPVPDITVIGNSGNNGLLVPFGNVSEMTSAERSVIIRNDGGADLVIEQIAVNDPLAAPFSIKSDNCTAETLTPNTNCSLVVQFLPPSATVFNDTFNISSNDPNENPQTVSVSGTGTAPGSGMLAPVAGGGCTIGNGESAIWLFILLVAGGGCLRRHTVNLKEAVKN